MLPDRELLHTLESGLDTDTLDHLQKAARAIITAKERGRRVVAVVGSGPNLHEGVSTLIAACIRKGLIDGVITSSAVVCHEMGGTLERVHRVHRDDLPPMDIEAPFDGRLEASILPPEQFTKLQEEMVIDESYYRLLLASPGKQIIKAAANLAYPLGLRTERLAREAQTLATAAGLPLEFMVGLGADPNTMLGAGARAGIPVIVGIPQLVGGGAVGLAIGDSMTITERANRVAHILDSADVIIESAVVLTQEIHDGPFENYTGHGLWAQWDGRWTFSLREKTIIRIDLDPNLRLAWERERSGGIVSQAIAEGLPKTKLVGVPFRMEMSGFCRLPGSLPLVTDIGIAWPLLMAEVSGALGVELDFYSYPQSAPKGQEMREWIVENVQPVSRAEMLDRSRSLRQELPSCKS